MSRCELLSDFVYSFFEHNLHLLLLPCERVVNCFQILYIRSLNTITGNSIAMADTLWIAFRFCIFVLWTQLKICHPINLICCELLSDFVYSFFEHNLCLIINIDRKVVNCFQILYIRSLNTMVIIVVVEVLQLWIAFRFCIFVLWTQFVLVYLYMCVCCELLSDFVYSFFEHNNFYSHDQRETVVNCFQILYIRSLNTIALLR